MAMLSAHVLMSVSKICIVEEGPNAAQMDVDMYASGLYQVSVCCILNMI